MFHFFHSNTSQTKKCRQTPALQHFLPLFCLPAGNGSKASATIDGVTKSRTGARSGALYIGASNSTYASYSRIYATKVYKDDVLVRDFIPVLDKDNIACMYDKVSGEYFYNQGSGEFIAGYK